MTAERGMARNTKYLGPMTMSGRMRLRVQAQTPVESGCDAVVPPRDEKVVRVAPSAGLIAGLLGPRHKTSVGCRFPIDLWQAYV